MGYCTLDDLINDFGEQEIIRITDRSRPATGQIDPAVVEKAVGDADAEINMYLEGRGLLPLPSVPDTLRRIASDITRYYLYQNPRDDSPVVTRYNQRIRQLEKVASGRLSLGLDNAGKVLEPDESVVFTPGRNMFRRDGLW
ncbi:TPA: DUF1320 domain-containing protein [Klebsiella pneumoniae]|uniref:gp436 family protein n=1 Tax=Klebsiella TaxID=570 RepID=UPI0007CBBF14|nr:MULTISPECIES: DUF1320 domain-containing protein [Klebsiella]EKW9769580.1 DUF1320 domain-containing protein [Klebsiella pneumoniae]EKZ5977246.1 DUF1320 domain-containing protein [Klebsiella pneumoniae]MBD7803888.1 DUF1320 domain-containing protein [Klebsiella pneumoniae]MDL4445121.1 DUF1320 domain-containing protein [Klebsiella michiganensis]MDL4485987.1 DUF1320 domain-containing protein [Klebsiella michiganensis]